MDKYPYVYIEDGKEIFYYTHIPELDELANPECALNIDGSKPKVGDAIGIKEPFPIIDNLIKRKI